ncbi:MAG: LysR family transcriptional regulator [Lautropia sp.]
MGRWSELELFVQIGELGSLSRAAEALQVSNATASRQLAALERRLGVQLVSRNTRRLALTSAGNEYFRHCKTMLADLQATEAAINAATLNPQGQLRVTASLSFCMKHIVPILPRFLKRYPALRVELVVSNRYYDLIENGIDVAIRTREFESDSNITVRRLAETRRILAASPQYLQRHGRPLKIEDLARHPLLIYTYSNQPDRLRFTKNGRTQVVHVKGLLEANDGQLLLAAAREHMGILVQPRYILHDDIVAGRLVPVLDDWDLPRLIVNIAFQSRRHLPARVRCFVDFLVEHFVRMDYERKWTV